jgi:CAAX protease family protein
MASSPRIRVMMYVVLTFGFSLPFYILCIRHGMKASYVFGLMWCPAAAGLLTTLLTKRSFREFGWRLGKPKYLLAAWSIPMVYSWPAYLLIWGTGLGGFPRHQGVDTFRSLLHMPSTPTWVLLIVAYAAGSVGAVLYGCLFAAGEEIGWRGFLVPELMKFNSFTGAAVISGVVWSAWHVPLIVWSEYNSGTPAWYATACFAVMVISISFVFAWVRLKSGSVWPAVLLHASHNAIIQGYLDALTVNRGHTHYFIGEFGCAMLPLTLLCAWIVWRRRAQVEGLGSRAMGETSL